MRITKADWLTPVFMITSITKDQDDSKLSWNRILSVTATPIKDRKLHACSPWAALFNVQSAVSVRSGLVLTSSNSFFSPVFVLLRNTAIRSFPPGGARAALLPLLPSAAARRVVWLADKQLALLWLALCLGGERPLGNFWVWTWWGHNGARAVGLGSREMALQEQIKTRFRSGREKWRFEKVPHCAKFTRTGFFQPMPQFPLWKTCSQPGFKALWRLWKVK